QEISQQFWQSYFPRARYHEVKCIEACCRLLPHFPLAIGSAHDDYHFLRLNPECLGEGKCGSVLLKETRKADDARSDVHNHRSARLYEIKCLAANAIYSRDNPFRMHSVN